MKSKFAKSQAVGIGVSLLATSQMAATKADEAMTDDAGIARRPPNVLFITTDQQRWDTLNATGNPHVNTPNLDRLAQMGVLFNHAYCNSPQCMPSRASFLTGRYPNTTGVMHNGHALPERQFEYLLSRRLHQEGFATGLAGKLHIHQERDRRLRSQSDERMMPHGHAEYHWSPTDTPSHWSACQYQSWLRRRGLEQKIEPFGDSRHVVTNMCPETSQVAWGAEVAADFIVAQKKYRDGRQWYFNLNWFDPHDPWDPPLELLQRYLDRLDDIPLPNYVEGELDNKPPHERELMMGIQGYPDYVQMDFQSMTPNEHRLLRAAYFANVDMIDMHVGRILDALEETGQLEDTLIIFTSDHGEALGDHGLFLKGDFYYDPVVRVPLIIAWPGTIPGDRKTDAFVELVDIVPTVLEASGLEVDRFVHGRSLMPFLLEQTDQHRDSVISMLANELIPRSSVMIRDEQYKLVWFSEGSDTGVLYNLVDDPNETHNLWDDPEYNEVRMKMMARLAERLGTIYDVSR